MQALLCVQVDDDMMKELKDTKAAIKATDTLLVVDAMTGQEAASLVKAFNDQAGITGAPWAGQTRTLCVCTYTESGQGNFED